MLLTELFINENRLGDFVDARTNMPDADFWLVRRGSEHSVGRPTREFHPEHIGVKVTNTERLDPVYLYYVMQYLYNRGHWRQHHYGTLNLKNIRVQDVQNLMLDMR